MSDIQTDVEVTGKVIIPKTIESPYVSRDVPVKYCNYVDLKKIVGASVVWNQLIKNGNFESTDNWSPSSNGSISASNNELTMTLTNIPPNAYTPYVFQNLNIYANKKYLISFDINIPHTTSVRVETIGGVGKTLPVTETNKYVHLATVYTRPTDSIQHLNIYPQYVSDVWSANETWKLKNVICIDLTAMFGTTIADYVYTLETAEAGTGIAWLQSYGFFTEDFYKYTENNIESVCTNGRTSKGITYPISAVELRGLFKLDNDELTVDGDEYEADGTITRKYGVVDLGDLNWSYNSQYSFFLTNFGGQKKNISDGLCTKYEPTDFNSILLETTDKVFCINSNDVYIRVKDTAYTDTTTFKNAVKGVYLLYELATPDIDLTIPFNERQKVGSTEQFDDYGVITGTRDVSIPVGNETDYLQNFAGQITGTLHYIEDGLAPSGYLSGSGNFIALHLDSDDWSRYTSVKVGLDPSQASGMVEILDDEEKIAVGKITDNEQVFIVESTDGEFTKTDVYSLSDLVLETE